jgi:acyl-coenzyme A synthetase/AMP-(fatty) acid ligase
VPSLWNALTASGAPISSALRSRSTDVALAELAHGSSLAAPPETLRGRTVALATRDQLTTALALIELDGVARRIVLCTPDLTSEQLRTVVTAAGADVLIYDAVRTPDPGLCKEGVLVRPAVRATPVNRDGGVDTEWILLTSGTTGAPKLVLHSMASLSGALPRHGAGDAAVWSTHYDIRRYGGLQIFLRAVLGGVPLVLSDAAETPGDFLRRAGAAGVTHISGTPSHWRRALMSGAAASISPQYVRLSGEIADQSVLDNLRHAFPGARIAHAFASTEAGVAFDVTDGQAGFPASLVGQGGGAIDMKVEDGTLRIRSARTAARYLGGADAPLVSDGGYVDTGDLVELRDGRYYFVGRRGGIINVGGLKVYPEEIEAVINADTRVRMSLVRSRRNPITGAIVVADVVLADGASVAADESAQRHLRRELLERCRAALPAHKVPAALHFVAALDVSPAGKLVRPDA